jgi:hypothetical protein
MKNLIYWNKKIIKLIKLLHYLENMSDHSLADIKDLLNSISAHTLSHINQHEEYDPSDPLITPLEYRQSLDYDHHHHPRSHDNYNSYYYHNHDSYYYPLPYQQANHQPNHHNKSSHNEAVQFLDNLSNNHNHNNQYQYDRHYSMPIPKDTVYICNIPFSATEEDLRQYIESQLCNNQRIILNVRFMMKEQGSVKKRWAFVKFGSTAWAEKCISELDQKVFMQRPLGIAFAHR